MENKENDINISLLEQNYQILKPKILVFGIGGAGTNAVNNMVNDDFDGVEFIVANTDAQSLGLSNARNKIQLGPKTTKGLGAGMVPEIGKEAAEEVEDEIVRYMEDASMIFITAGMGGGTGTGAAPVIARLARERDILTIAVVTKPFEHENAQRMTLANKGIEELKKFVDTLIVVPNQNLYKIANENTTLKESFEMVDNVLKLGVKGITDLITQAGLVNLDFADIKTVMKKMGKSMMGMGEADGENRAIIAAEAAISNPLLDNSSIRGAKGIVVNITASPDFTLFEYEAATKKIKEEADPNAVIIIGNALNENMDGKVRISVFATGIDDDTEDNKIVYNNKIDDVQNIDSTDIDYDDHKAEFYDNDTESDSISDNNNTYLSSNKDKYIDKNTNNVAIHGVRGFEGKTTNSNELSKYDEMKQKALDMYLKEKEEKENKQQTSNNSIKKIWGFFSGNNNSRTSNSTTRTDSFKLSTDDDFDMDIDVFNTSTYLKKKK